MHSIWRSLFYSVTTATLCGFSSMPAAQASTAVPMTIMSGDGTFIMSVPQSSTTQSAYGGKLRLYDVHIAKMFEVTHYMCKNKMLAPSATWVYRARGAEIDMGTFEVSCKLANDLALAYGFRAPESTEIQWFHDETDTLKITRYSIPVLDITRQKSDRWMNFTSNFKPVGS